MSSVPRNDKSLVGVIGAGAMGAGICQVAALAGHQVILCDAHDEALLRARDTISKSLGKLIEKGKTTTTIAQETLGRITFSDTRGGDPFRALSDRAIILEAIVEDLERKRELFRLLEDVVSPETILASNTSSLSITALASGCKRPERVVGIHFFNPVPIMNLVEAIPGVQTSPSHLSTASELVRSWGKTVVTAIDTPGFIVNRVARPYYSESLRILEENLCTPATLDWALKSIYGFKMGPCELMDFIGHDVNFKVTKSVFEATYFEPRYRPSLLQERLVQAGRLGRKSGHGFYDYQNPLPAPLQDQALGAALGRRVLVMLMNEAIDAVLHGIASAADIDRAMTLGVNYPKGLISWAEEFGLAAVLGELEILQAEYGDMRYRPSALLRRSVSQGQRSIRSTV